MGFDEIGDFNFVRNEICAIIKMLEKIKIKNVRENFSQNKLWL